MARIESLRRMVAQSSQLLENWQMKKLAAENPSEIMRAELQITQIEKQLEEYRLELAAEEKKQRANNTAQAAAELTQADRSEEYTCFLSFANEDKPYATRLYQALKNQGLSIWYSGTQLKLGDGIADSVNQGLSNSRYGIVLLSPSYLGKKWPISELHALFAKYTAFGNKVILPIWHDLSYEEVLTKAPLIADKFAISTDQELDTVVQAIIDAVED